METLIESDLPNETYVRIHQTVQLLVLLAATVSIVITTITIVYSKGRGMETYKYYLLHELFWNYGFDTVICLWMPVNMFPYQCSYSIGILKNSTGDYQHFLTCLSSVMATGKALAIYTAVVYRYSQALSPQRHPVLQRLVHPNILVYIAVFVVVQFAMVFPLAVNRSTPSQIQAKSDESAVVKRVSETQPSFICIENGAGGTLTFMYILIGTLLTLFIGTIALCLVHLRQLMRSGSSMSSATYRIQVSLL
ncbi:unnamed protein product [Bursaphelenchus xylophilus]|nr:unnamed protein product [Bursaphelenchus xylophilus]CAG9081135.1 unnamed protein product [Bursaphelenchus xylophilus]